MYLAGQLDFSSELHSAALWRPRLASLWSGSWERVTFGSVSPQSL